MSIIAEKLSVFDLLCQCAEEAAELAQACSPAETMAECADCWRRPLEEV